MAINSTVRWHRSSMEGAPELRPIADSMLGMLRACLTLGFTPKAADGITVTAGVATVTFGSTHKFFIHSVIEVSGATPAGLNDVWRVTGVTSDTFTFACPGIPDGAATGTISVRVPPTPYWEEVFTGTNKAVFRSTHPLSNGFLLRVEDSDARRSRIRGYESMTDVDTGVDPFPQISQQSEDDFRWMKKVDTTNIIMPWTMFSDERAFYFALNQLHPLASYPNHNIWHMFGENVSVDPADIWNTVITGESASEYWSTTPLFGATNAFRRAARDPAGAAKSVFIGVWQVTALFTLANHDYPGYLGKIGYMPHSVLNTNAISGGFRGSTPGLYANTVKQNRPNFVWDSLITDPPAFDVLPNGHRCAFMPAASSSLTWATLAVDIIGPWR